MIGRIIGVSFIGGTPTVAPTPLTILGAGSLVAWWEPSRDVTDDGSGNASAMSDQTTNANNLAQGTSSTRPLIVAAGLNGLTTIRGDGVDDVMVNTTISLAAPGTTPVFISGVAKQISWTSGDRLYGPNSGAGCIIQSSNATPQVRQLCNNVSGTLNGGFVLGSWKRFEAYYDSSGGAGYLKIGSTSVGGTTGNTTTAGFQLFAGAGAAFGNFELAGLLIANRLPNAGELSSLDSYWTSRFGGGLT